MSSGNDTHILVSELNNRIQYTFRHVFYRMMGVRPIFTNDKEAFVQYNGPKLNYSKARLGDELYIKPCGVLYEKGVKDREFHIDVKDGLPFYYDDPQSEFHFDVFSAIFFLLSRYEEYFKFQPDEYGRFEANESIAFKHGFLEEPVVELWVEMIKKALKQRYPEMAFCEPEFKHIPTIDVDSAFAYLHKGYFRTMAATVKNALKRDFSEISRRFLTLTGRTPDMFNNFKYLEDLLKEKDVPPVFFFLSGEYGRFDKNIPMRKKAMKKIVSEVASFAEIGLHPSYASNHAHFLFELEKQRLEKCLNGPVHKSRQHYLKVRFPQTYHDLIKYGMNEDYSMGYATTPGFRAGTCTPYNFYDLSKERETTLKIIPFQTMDTTFTTYLKLTPEEAEKKIMNLLEKVKSVRGTFVSLWHNDTFAPNDRGLNWRKVFENVINFK
jgi:hypothetical protein